MEENQNVIMTQGVDGQPAAKEQKKMEQQHAENRNASKNSTALKEYKGIVIALIAGLCAVLCVAIFSGSLVSYKKTSGSGGITATGSANCDFEADLIVWRGSFSAYGRTSQDAYKSINKDSKVIKKYLLDNGVTQDEMVFSSVTINQRWENEYNYNGDKIGEYLDGYDLYQDICITSNDVDKIEGISRDISELIESNVEFISYEPEYYYTKLDELKLQLIEEATTNAKARIDLISEGSGAGIGKLLNANLGVFQITAQNSNTEYSYGGAFDTSSRYKTASITVKLNYATE